MDLQSSLLQKIRDRLRTRESVERDSRRLRDELGNPSEQIKLRSEILRKWELITLEPDLLEKDCLRLSSHSVKNYPRVTL